MACVDGSTRKAELAAERVSRARAEFECELEERERGPCISFSAAAEVERQTADRDRDTHKTQTAATVAQKQVFGPSSVQRRSGTAPSHRRN